MFIAGSELGGKYICGKSSKLGEFSYTHVGTPKFILVKKAQN